MNHIEIAVYRITIWFIKRGYGDRCETEDIEDFPELKHNQDARCGRCRAYEIVDWLEEQIAVIKENT